MSKYLVMLIVTTCLNGLIVAIGYSTLIEKIPEFSVLFLVAMFAHLVVTAYLIAHGFMYNELKQAVEHNLRDLLDTYQRALDGEHDERV